LQNVSFLLSSTYYKHKEENHQTCKLIYNMFPSVFILLLNYTTAELEKQNAILSNWKES